jgi:hypothetical protein
MRRREGVREGDKKEERKPGREGGRIRQQMKGMEGKKTKIREATQWKTKENKNNNNKKPK